MSAIVRIIPDSDLEVLQRYIDAEGVLLIRESIADKHFQQEKADLEGLELIEYSFGGEADVWMDVVTTDQHYAMDAIRKELMTLKQDDEPQEEG